MASVSSTGLGAVAGTEASPSLVSDGALTLDVGFDGRRMDEGVCERTKWWRGVSYEV